MFLLDWDSMHVAQTCFCAKHQKTCFLCSAVCPKESVHIISIANLVMRTYNEFVFWAWVVAAVRRIYVTLLWKKCIVQSIFEEIWAWKADELQHSFLSSIFGRLWQHIFLLYTHLFDDLRVVYAKYHKLFSRKFMDGYHNAYYIVRTKGFFRPWHTIHDYLLKRSSAGSIAHHCQGRLGRDSVGNWSNILVI